MKGVAIQGVRGAFSHAAAMRVLGPEVDVVECDTFEQLIEMIRPNGAAFGVVPVENTLAGTVQRNMDLVLESGIPIVAETRVRVELCLIGRPGARNEELRTIASHPVALQQCRRFFREHPCAAPRAAFDTAGSVRDLMAGTADYDAAIGAELAASLYGGEVLRRGLEDHAGNYTRFLVVGRESVASRTGALKTSFAFEVRHEPGSLHRALAAVAQNDLDLTRLESRPIPGRPWEYRFYADLRGGDAARQDVAIDALRGLAQSVILLGRYSEEDQNAPAYDV